MNRLFAATATTAFAALLTFAASSLRAQAPPGPLPGGPPKDAPPDAQPAKTRPAIKPRDTILGPWRLNTDESEDARQKLQQIPGNDRSSGGYGAAGPRIGGGHPGHGGYGRTGNGESPEDLQKMQELMRPANSLAISMTGAEVDVIDDQDRKRALITDGRKLQKPKDASYQEIAAKWEGKTLVTDEKDPRGNKMSRRFELSEDGRQLFETIHMTLGSSRSPLVIRYVYDQPTGSPSGR